MVTWFKRTSEEFDSRFNFRYLRFRLGRENAQINAHLNSLEAIGELPALSIVVPTYGVHLDLVKEFVASVLRQTYKNWELCICDDGDSDPKVSEYLTSLSRQYPQQVRFKRLDKNVGIVGATRVALALASHEYIVLADSDDRLHPRACEVFASAIAAHPKSEFFYSNHDYMTDWGFRLRPMLKPGWSPELLIQCNYINHLKVIKRDFFQGIIDEAFNPLYNGCQDWSLGFEVLQHAHQVTHIPLILYHWRTRKGSMASDPMWKPWAVEAQVKMRTNYISRLSAELKWEPALNRPRFKNEPSIETVAISSSDEKSLDSLIGLVKERTGKSTSDYIQFADAGQPGYQNEAAAYCALPNVACVWPFRENLVRLAYTPTDSKEDLLEFSPIKSHRGSYSWLTSNVLAGPLIGLTVRRERLLAMLDNLPKEIYRYEGKPSEVLGILLSFSALKLGMRNVSSNAGVTAYEPSKVSLPRELVTAFDPYI